MKTTMGILALAALGAAAVACSDDDITAPPASDGTTTPGDNAPTNPGDTGPTTGTKPLYGLNVNVFTDTSRTTYITLLDSLETQADVTLAQGREFAGYAAAAVAGGKLFVNDGETPKVTRFAIADDKTWTEEAPIGFSNFTQASVGDSIFVSDTVAYAPFDAFSYVTWNPATATIGAELPDPTGIPLQRDGLNVTRGFARMASGKLAYQSFYWTDASYAQMHRTSQVGILSTETNQWVGTPEVACPHLHVGSVDDGGNVYFSNGQYSIVAAVLDAQAPRNCMVRLNAGATTVDPTYPVYFKDLAGGREGSNFFYSGDGKGFFNAYHPERETAPLTAQLVQYSANYHLWRVDLATKQAEPMPGIDYAGGQYSAFRLDGRVFVAIPAADYSSTTIWEVTAAGAEKRFVTQGWTFNIFRIR